MKKKQTKFYFISYWYKWTHIPDDGCFQSKVIVDHPFKWVKSCEETAKVEIIFFKEITEKEFELWHGEEE